VHPDGTVEMVPPAEATQQVFLTLQELLPRQVMSVPASVDPESMRRAKAIRCVTSRGSRSRSSGHATYA
jgi:hypothetical protein